MKKVASHYFSHLSVWTYIAIGIAVGVLCFNSSYFSQYWYVCLIPILIAPFFEWFAHKYILHMQIGNVVEIPFDAKLKKENGLTMNCMAKIKKCKF